MRRKAVGQEVEPEEVEHAHAGRTAWRCRCLTAESLRLPGSLRPSPRVERGRLGERSGLVGELLDLAGGSLETAIGTGNIANISGDDQDESPAAGAVDN